MEKTFIKLSPDPWFVTEGAYPELSTPQKKIKTEKLCKQARKDWVCIIIEQVSWCKSFFTVCKTQTR
jgi:hypothetical protein